MLDLLYTNIRKNIFDVVNKLGYLDENILKDENDIILENPKDSSFGDISTNIAMKLAKAAHKAPIIIAEEITSNLNPTFLHLSNISIANPGFINFSIDINYLIDVINVINNSDNYGASNKHKGENICLEYVSANPTGYLHVGHGRGAAYGDSLANVMEKVGYQVNREHYVNDAGNQITNMAYSVYARYKELYGLPLEIPEDGYHGKEIIEVAKKFRDFYGDKYLNNFDLKLFREFGTNELLNNLKKDLKIFNVEFDTWFSETSLYETKQVEKVLTLLQEKDCTYIKDQATWLKTTPYGDEKDRVIIKSDGSYTYLLPDIAYHANKLNRGYDHLIDVLGADHHGYIPRLKAAVAMVGGDANLIDVEILQMVRVLENGVEVKMSKRSGKAITLIDLIDEVGTDALRYFYVDKALSTHMDLDLDFMKTKSNDNPVYYAQYAHARICGVFNKYQETGNKFIPCTTFDHINKDKLKPLLLTLVKYPNLILEVAEKKLVHKIPHYIYELSSQFHSYYNDEKIISDNIDETNEKLTILLAVKTVLKDALNLIGVSAPSRMEQK